MYGSALELGYQCLYSYRFRSHSSALCLQGRRLPCSPQHFVEIDVDINAVDREGETALSNATLDRHTSCWLYLLEVDAAMDIVSGSGDAPIQTAILQNMHETLSTYWIVVPTTTGPPFMVRQHCTLQLSLRTWKQLSL